MQRPFTPRFELTSDFQNRLKLAERLGDAARAVTLPLFRNHGDTVNKLGDKGFDPVTKADRDAEAAMREILDQDAPDDAINGEEFGLKEGRSGWTWYLDPVDGTRAFIAGLPSWTTLIGCALGSTPEIGVIDQPWLDDDVRDADDALAKDVVGDAERLLQRRPLLDEVEQAVVGDDDHRVDVLRQLADRLVRLPRPPHPLEGEGFGHDADGERAALLRRVAPPAARVLAPVGRTRGVRRRPPRALRARRARSVRRRRPRRRRRRGRAGRAARRRARGRALRAPRILLPEGKPEILLNET